MSLSLILVIVLGNLLVLGAVGLYVRNERRKQEAELAAMRSQLADLLALMIVEELDQLSTGLMLFGGSGIPADGFGPFGHPLSAIFSDMHRHKCPDCEFVWEHTEQQGLKRGSHNCPRCGTPQHRKYFGSDPPGQPAR